MSRVKSGKRPSVFWKIYLIYLAVIVVLLAALYMYVRGVMIDYENSSPDKYILSMLEEGEKGGLAGCLKKADTFDGADARMQSFLSTAGDAELEVKTSAQTYRDSVQVYNVLADGKPFLTVGLEDAGEQTKLGIITISDWEIDTCILRDPESPFESIKLAEDGKVDCTVSVPEGFTLLMDGEAVEISSGSETPIEAFEYIAPYNDVPVQYELAFEDLSFEPHITALNNGGSPVEAECSGTDYTIAPDYAETEEAKELCASVADPLYIGELWSKFMTDDIGGSGHGLSKVRSDCMLLAGTNLYTLATNWASNVDITFVSGHVINSFTNESVSNYVKYNDKFFSCDVYFEKNMTLKTGAARTDVFSNRMCFVYMDDGSVPEGWYLADMISISAQ